jgi:hypothetical protein
MSKKYLNYITQWQYQESCEVAGHVHYPFYRHSLEL